MHSPALKRKPYGNCVVRDLQNDIIFYCNHRRANWYLKRNLAVVLNEEPLEIQLTFKTKGKGNFRDEFYLQPRQNVCVVCGESYENGHAVNRHHIVPLCFRRHFPNNMKSHSYHDVLILCVRDHEAYERHADKFKVKLGEEYNIPVHGVMDNDSKDRWINNYKASGYARVLLSKHSDRIPDERKSYMLSYIKEITGTDDLQVVLNTAATPIETEPMGKLIVDKLDDIHAFCQRWRQHFLDTMKPAHLPKFWSVHRASR
jgi:hypothetical protein